MAATPFDSKTIDQLKELGKLTGNEKFIISINENDTKKVSTDTIVGYAVSVINKNNLYYIAGSGGSGYGQCIIFIPEGEEISLPERTPGCYYLEERNQVSLRTQINIPTSVKVSKTLGLRRV